MDKRFLGILVGLAIIFGGIFALSQNSSNKSSTSTTGSTTAQATNHVEGLGQKHVTLVEYGDYECSVCEAYYSTVKQVAAQFNNDIYFQFRNLPLVQVHPNAFAAARAAEAAGLQGKFWQMHDALYNQTNWQNWSTSTNAVNFFNTYAQQLGLNVNQFKSDYSSTKVNDAVNADLGAFAKTGRPQATPTYFLDGKYIDNAQLADPSTGLPTVAKFAALINAEIAKKNQ